MFEIDTEGSFMVQRMAKMARALVESIHVMKVFALNFLSRCIYFHLRGISFIELKEFYNDANISRTDTLLSSSRLSRAMRDH